MFRVLTVIFAIQLSIVGALAQSRQPANITTTPAVPAPNQNLQVLDPTGTWVPMGVINPITHSFGSIGASYPDHATLLAQVPTPGAPQSVIQLGFYTSGDGGEAVYNWNTTSLCPNGAADGFSCILPLGQSPSTPGRYLLSFLNGSLNARQFGLRPGIGDQYDNSPLLPAIFAAIAPPGFGPNGVDIIFTPNLGQGSTNYYFSQPFEVTHGSSISCSNSSSVAGGAFIGNAVEFTFPAGVPGIAQENARMSASGGGDIGSTIIGCDIGSLGRFNTGGGAVQGDSQLTGVAWARPIAWTGATPTFAAGDGIIAAGLHAIYGGPVLRPGTYVQSVGGSAGSQTLNLGTDSTGAQYVVGKQEVNVFAPAFLFTAAHIWRLPASEKRRVTTTAGSANAVITGGQRPIKVGEWIWSEPFVFGSLVMTENNQLASATVNSGGAGYTGTSGTMTWAGNGCAWGTNPVLNVTASGGVITAVTGVATAGQCNGAWPSPTATTWTPGGGLSGGSGATFNTVFANHVTMSTMAASDYPSPASETGTFDLWTLPAGITRRVGASTKGNMVEKFPISLELYCDAGGGFATGCANSRDEGNSMGGGLVGRYVTGADCAPSLSLHNVYGDNMSADIIESCTLSNVYINENTNSPENDVGKYSALGLCNSENGSIWIGGYIVTTTVNDGFCLGTDVNGNANMGVAPASPETQGSMLSIGAYFPSMAGINGRGDANGSFRWFGYSAKTELVQLPAAIGDTTIALQSFFGTLAPGYTVIDQTNPAAIPSGTTVATINAYTQSVTISNPVASPGLAVNDKIEFVAPAAGCIHTTGGVDLVFEMSVDCVSFGFHIGYSATFGSFAINSLWFPSGGWPGYQGGQDVVAPEGIALGNTYSYQTGQERVLSMGYNLNGQDWHLQGDTTLNTAPSSGGILAATNATVFNTTVSVATPVGATSVQVASCPNPALPAYTPIMFSQGTGGYAQHILGDLASCTGTTLTLQGPALVATVAGWRIDFLQWLQAGRVANDPWGISVIPANRIDIANLLSEAPCNAQNIGLGVVSNGETVAAAGYNATVGTLGGTTRLVFCDGASWTYH